MKGVQFVVNALGKKTAMVIDLKKHSEVWEDFYDAATARQRRDEPRETFESAKRRFRRRGNLSSDS